jgi:hypothetical protein
MYVNIEEVYVYMLAVAFSRFLFNACAASNAIANKIHFVQVNFNITSLIIPVKTRRHSPYRCLD